MQFVTTRLSLLNRLLVIFYPWRGYDTPAVRPACTQVAYKIPGKDMGKEIGRSLVLMPCALRPGVWDIARPVMGVSERFVDLRFYPAPSISLGLWTQ